MVIHLGICVIAGFFSERGERQGLTKFRNRDYFLDSYLGCSALPFLGLPLEFHSQ